MAKRAKSVLWNVWVDDDGALKIVENFMHSDWCGADPTVLAAHRNAAEIVYGSCYAVVPDSEGEPT